MSDSASVRRAASLHKIIHVDMDAFFALLYRRAGDLAHRGHPCRVAPVRASVRLLGVTVSGLSSVEVVPPDAGQMNLLEEAVDLR